MSVLITGVSGLVCSYNEIQHPAVRKAIKIIDMHRIRLVYGAMKNLIFIPSKFEDGATRFFQYSLEKFGWRG
jgi:hypothetical protein